VLGVPRAGMRRWRLGGLAAAAVVLLVAAGGAGLWLRPDDRAPPPPDQAATPVTASTAPVVASQTPLACFTHLNGVSIAHAQGAAKCGNVRSDPQNSYQTKKTAQIN
jgi:hypothetical protein